MEPARPNTGVENGLLSDRMILCCGEDGAELLQVLRTVFPEQETAYHEYRCYRFWKFTEFTLVWTGIGTGCLEPLLFELFAGFTPRELVLIGTCGAIPGRGIMPGDVFLVGNAYLGGAALRLPESALPLTCRYGADKVARLGLDKRSTISTDFYYGFAVDPGPPVQRLQAETLGLKADLAAHWDRADAVEMEVGQFYYLCGLLGGPELEYAAIKGAANATDAVAQQTMYSARVLQQALRSALQLLGVTGRPAPALAAAEGTAGSGDLTKLTEEIKLYWTIQLAVCAVLGYLGSNLDLMPERVATAENAKNFIVSLIAFILISIGSIYNLVGNYYIRMSGYTLEGADQEDIISPSLAVAYLIVSAIMGALILYSCTNIFWQNGTGNVIAVVAGLFFGFFINYNYCRFVLKELCKRDRYAKFSGKYSEKLRWLYRCPCPGNER